MTKAFDYSSNLNDEQRTELKKAEKSIASAINNFHKKNNGGNGINAYSGVFNPRAVARNDYRYFERSISTNGNNRFGTAHLNLFIDESGSFWNSQDIVNQFLKILTKIESTNKNFSLDVVFVGMGERLTDKKTRELYCHGGNLVDAKAKDIFRKLQKNNTYNYNIVLFDGDAFSDSPENRNTCKKLFSAFDAPNTLMITDPYNEQYINFTATKVITTHDYTTELIANVTKCITDAFH